MRIVEFTPLSYRVGHGRITLPQNLKNKKAVVNVANTDGKCFLYAVLSVIHYKPDANIDRVSYYSDKFNSVNITDITFPFNVGQLKKFHTNNPTIGVNMLQWCENDECAKVLVTAPLDENRRIINVLLVEISGQSHFVGVPNLNRLLNCGNIHSRYFCHRCLYPFFTISKLLEHTPLCVRNIIQNCVMTKDKFYSFKNHSASVSPSHVIYADLESLLTPTSDNVSNHQVIAAAFLVIPNIKIAHKSPFT